MKRQLWLLTALALLAIVGAAGVALAGRLGAGEAADRPRQRQTISAPIFAYYAIDFTPRAWSFAKGDFPTIGRYSSDEEAVLRMHIEWAKAAGIEGFIVRWRSANSPTEQLSLLASVAAAEDFKLGIAYEAEKIDGSRVHQRRVRADLDTLIETIDGSQAFDAFDKPLVIWMGTERYTRRQIAQTTRDRRDDLLILASESSVQGIERLANVVDGNAYEWPLLDPQTRRNFPRKLAAMGEVVREMGGIWIAVAAPGFDGLELGAVPEVVPRRSGTTFKRRLAGAAQSEPALIGLLSWNEFSDSTHIEASQLYGAQYLEIVAESKGKASELARTLVANGIPVDIPPEDGFVDSTPLLGGVVVVGLVALLGVARRSWRDDVRGDPRGSGQGTTIRAL